MAANWKQHLFDNDLYQRDDIETLRQNAELDGENIHRMRQRLDRLERRIDRAELVVETLFMALENQGLLNPQIFQTLLREVDALDGRVDGRAGVKPSKA